MVLQPLYTALRRPLLLPSTTELSTPSERCTCPTVEHLHLHIRARPGEHFNVLQVEWRTAGAHVQDADSGALIGVVCGGGVVYVLLQRLPRASLCMPLLSQSLPHTPPLLRPLLVAHLALDSRFSPRSLPRQVSTQHPHPPIGRTPCRPCHLHAPDCPLLPPPPLQHQLLIPLHPETSCTAPSASVAPPSAARCSPPPPSTTPCTAATPCRTSSSPAGYNPVRALCGCNARGPLLPMLHRSWLAASSAGERQAEEEREGRSGRQKGRRAPLSTESPEKINKIIK